MMNGDAIFEEMISELANAGFIERLIMLKVQFENDIARIGTDSRLNYKLQTVNKALASLNA